MGGEVDAFDAAADGWSAVHVGGEALTVELEALGFAAFAGAGGGEVGRMAGSLVMGDLGVFDGAEGGGGAALGDWEGRGAGEAWGANLTGVGDAGGGGGEG